MREMKEKKYWNPYFAGVMLGLLLFASFYITGHGVGASGAVNRVTVFLESFVAQNHINMTPYLAHMAGGSLNPLNSWLVWMLLGILLGGAVSGLLGGRLKAEIFRGPNITPATRMIAAVIGGVIMGYGARMARGCTSGQGLSGGSVLSVGSWAFLLAIFAGAYITAIFARRLWR